MEKTFIFAGFGGQGMLIVSFNAFSLSCFVSTS